MQYRKGHNREQVRHVCYSVYRNWIFDTLFDNGFPVSWSNIYDEVLVPKLGDSI